METEEKETEKRLEFVKEHKKWTIEQWKNVLWNDESNFWRADERCVLEANS